MFGWLQNKKSRKMNVVGITSRAPESSFQWLVDILNSRWSDLFEVTYFPITNSNRRDWEETVRMCSAVILYHTKHQGRINVTDLEGALYDDELKYLHKTLGRKKVLVLLDDIGDESEEEKRRILQTQPSLDRLSSCVILIPEKNKYEVAIRKLTELHTSISEGMGTSRGEDGSSWTHGPSSSVSQRQPIHSDDTKHGKPHTTNSTSSKSNAPSRASLPAYQIGIFSRSAESNYTWLVENLKADERMRPADIKAVCITNNYKMFSSEMQKCHFAILYHTQKQGRLNITDVADSLYDQELRDMSKFLGKQNVIVVVDDLKSGEPENKERIMKCQPSIGEFAQDLFLFTEKQKHTRNLEIIRGIIQRSLSDFTASHNVRQSSLYSTFESIKGFFGSSVDGPKNKIAQDRMSTRDSSPSYSGSVGYHTTSQRSDINESQSKSFQTLSSNENTNPKEVKGLSNFQDQHNVHQTPSNSDWESSMRKLGSSSDGHKITEDQMSTRDSSPSYSGSAGYHTTSQRSDGSQSNRPKPLSPNENTNPMEVKGLPNFQAQHNVRQTPSHSVKESRERNHGYSTDGPKNKITEDRMSTRDSPPSYSGSVGYHTTSQRSDINESQPKSFQTLSSNENTNPMEVKCNLSDVPLPELFSAITMKINASEQENQKLRETTITQKLKIRELESTVSTLTTEKDTMRKMMEEMRKKNSGHSKGEREEVAGLGEDITAQRGESNRERKGIGEERDERKGHGEDMGRRHLETERRE